LNYVHVPLRSEGVMTARRRARLRKRGGAGRGARKEIPDEPCRRDPEIESGVQSEGRNDLDFDEDVNESEKREHGLRRVAKTAKRTAGRARD